jgi:hypothetical protein
VIRIYDGAGNVIERTSKRAISKISERKHIEAKSRHAVKRDGSLPKVRLLRWVRQLY